MALKTYDVKELQIILGSVKLRGFAEDSVASIQWESDMYNPVVGADGETTRSRQNNNNATVTVTLMQNSDAHSDLQATFLRDASVNTKVFEFRLYDGITGEAYQCSEAFVKRLPDTEFGKDIGEREWQIYCVNLQQKGSAFEEILTGLTDLL